MVPPQRDIVIQVSPAFSDGRWGGAQAGYEPSTMGVFNGFVFEHARLRRSNRNGVDCRRRRRVFRRFSASALQAVVLTPKDGPRVKDFLTRWVKQWRHSYFFYKVGGGNVGRPGSVGFGAAD
jgi:hypothetical protein